MSLMIKILLFYFSFFTYLNFTKYLAKISTSDGAVFIPAKMEKAQFPARLQPAAVLHLFALAQSSSQGGNCRSLTMQRLYENSPNFKPEDWLIIPIFPSNTDDQAKQ